MYIQGPLCSAAEQENLENQRCSRFPLLEHKHTVLKSEQPSPRTDPRHQVCDLCKVEPGDKVAISQEWQNALWVAEKQVVTRIQPLVQSPILTRYAGAAYSLKQKPWGWCCKACETWVFNQKQSELQSGFSGVAQVWPQLSEAALTGPLYFPVDFEPWEAGEPGGIQQGDLVNEEEHESKASDAVTGVKASSRELNAPKQTRQTWCQAKRKKRQSPDRPYEAGPSTQGSRIAARPGVSRKEQCRFEQSEPSAPTRQDWCQLSDILVQQPQFCMKVKEAALLSWIERFESFLVPGSLGCWVANRIPECLAGDDEDTIGILAGIEDVKMQGAARPKEDCCRILQANITSYRSEIRQWLVSNQWHVACLQETHQVESATEAMTSSLKAVALEPWALPAAPTQGGSTGGLVSVSRSNYQTRFLHKHGESGKGFVFSGIRFHGWEMAIGNLYLESGVGPEGGVNPGLLAALALFLQELRIPWIVVGDWNCTHDEMASSGFLQSVHGRLLAPLDATTSQGSSIDFGVVCAKLAGCVSVETEWNVPFKPHAALLFTVHKAGASLPVPQPPKFVETPGENQAAGGEKDIREVLAMFEPPSQQEQDVQWGRVVAKLEADLQMPGKGRGWCFPVKREPLVAPTAPDKAWQGGKVAFWERIQLWIQQRQERPLKPSQVKLFIRHLQHVKHMLEPEEHSQAEFLRTELEKFVIGHPTNMTLVSTVVANAKEAASEWRKSQQESYQTWLQGAVEGGMRGLYKSLKKPENIQARPYRDDSSELRPHLRRQEWKQVWKPQADNSPEDHHLFEELRQKAAEELRQVGPLTDKQVAEALRKMAKKACGPDGLTGPMLKALEPYQVTLVADAFRTWEATGVMPEAATMSLVALLPKKESEERPIALTSYAYRAWCKSRYPLHEEWARQYQLSSPWDRAVKNHSSLEVAVTRVLKGEMHRQSQKSGITLLLDLKGFYENVSHKDLIVGAFKHRYPALLLHGAMQLYRGKRHLCAENMVSAPLVATQGILAGCPLAPGLSKLVMHDIVEPIWQGPPQCHVDLYIDDTGFDVVHNDPRQCANMAYQVWQEARKRFRDAKLPLSIGKTAWICSNKKVEKALSKLLQAGDPTIRDIHRDLGVDSGWGKRRRIVNHRSRMCKGGARKKRLDTLAPDRGPKIRAYKQGVLSVALYGHVAIGLAPKRLKWIRHQQAQVLGRMSLGSTEYVLELANSKHEDPAFTVINQHFRFFHQLLVKWNQGSLEEIEVSWRFWYKRILNHKEPWRIVVGPIGAAVCYLKALGWTAPSLTVWRAGDEEFHLLDRASLHALSFALRRACNEWRWKALSHSEAGISLENGVQWQAPGKARKKLKGLKNKALVAVWQGAIRHGSGAWCARCDQEASLKHVLWECSWWKDNQPEPADFPRLRKEYPDSSLWLRGLPGKQPRPPCYAQVLQESGIFQQSEIEAEALHFATDGSPGGSQDSRFQVATWGVIAFKIHGSEIQVVGSASGPVPCEQTVFRAEAQALVYLVGKVQGNLEVTIDAQSVTKAVRRRPGWKSEDLIQPLREASERLHLTWVNSHLTQQEFASKFGDGELWRWKANQLVDDLVQNQANSRRDMKWEQKVLIGDEVVIKVNNVLARRAEELLQSDSSQGPQIIFPGRLSPAETVSPKKRTKGPRQAKIIKFSSQARTKTQAQGPGDIKPNKRKQMEAMLEGTGPDLGHTWVVGHKSRDQLTIKCSTCGLYVEQTEPVQVFNKKASHHCLFQGPPFPLPAHGSHRIVNGGRAWLCTKCGLKQWVNQESLSGALSKECRQRYQGKDPWVKEVIKKAVPKTSFFQTRGAPVVSPDNQARTPVISGSSEVLQTAVSRNQGRQAVVHGDTLTSDGDAGDEVGEDVAGGGVVPNQRTSDKPPPNTKGGKQPVPKAKPKPKAPGRARPQSADPQQTKLTFK